jgi:hypothetical protein
MEQYKCNVVLICYESMSKQCTCCFNTYQMQDLIYIETMLVICPFDIAALHRVVLML